MPHLLSASAGPLAFGFGVAWCLVVRSRHHKMCRKTNNSSSSRAPCPSLQLKDVSEQCTDQAPALPTARGLAPSDDTIADVDTFLSATSLDGSRQTPAPAQAFDFSFAAQSLPTPHEDNSVLPAILWPSTQTTPCDRVVSAAAAVEAPFKFPGSVAQHLACDMWPMPTKSYSKTAIVNHSMIDEEASLFPSALTDTLYFTSPVPNFGIRRNTIGTSSSTNSTAGSSSSSSSSSPLTTMQAQLAARAAKVEQYCCAIEGCSSRAERSYVAERYTSFLMFLPLSMSQMAFSYNLKSLRRACSAWKVENGISESAATVADTTAAAAMPSYYDEF